MYCLRLKPITKIFKLLNDQHIKITGWNKFFSVNHNYFANSSSLKLEFLNYLAPNEFKSTEDAIIEDRNLISHHNSFINNNNDNNNINNDNNNVNDSNGGNVTLLNIHDKDFWTADLDKHAILSILQNTDESTLKNILGKIEYKCCILINDLSVSELLQILNLCMRSDDSRITSRKFYQKAIKILKVALERDELSTQEIFMLLYFASLKKKSGYEDVKAIKRRLPRFNKLSLIELCIVSDALFTCSVKLTNFEIRSIEKTIESNVDFLLKEKHLLLLLCKILKYVGPSKYFNIESLSTALKKSSDTFDAKFSGHLSSLYAEMLIKDNEVLSKLYNDALDNLEQNKESIRRKDIDRLLWAAQTLNYQLKTEHLDEIERCVKLQFSSFKTDNIKLMNIILNLWMLQHPAKQLINQCFKENIFNSIVANTDDWKSRAKLQLLISCIKIEAPEIEIPATLEEPHNPAMKVTKNYKMIYRKMQKLRDDLKLTNLEITCPIRGIYMPSIAITYNNDQTAFIDMLDNVICLRNCCEPYGLMNLKFRLLKNAGFKSILITEECLNGDDEQLSEYLKEKLIN